MENLELLHCLCLNPHLNSPLLKIIAGNFDTSDLGLAWSPNGDLVLERGVLGLALLKDGNLVGAWRVCQF